VINYSISLATGADICLFQNCTEPFIRWYGVIQFYRQEVLLFTFLLMDPHIINLNFLLQNFRQLPSKLYNEIWHLANNKTLT